MIKSIGADRVLLAYIIGIALGDGNLSNPNGRGVRLRISCDTKYPNLVNKIVHSLEIVFPSNRVSLVKRKENCVEVSVYSNFLESLLGWFADRGSKFVQQVSIPNWIFKKREYQIACLRGLLETDGSIYIDRGYRTVMFTSIIKPLAEATEQIFRNLGFASKFYSIMPKGTRFNYQMRYNIRLVKDVQKFLEIVKPEKF
jgi:DNA-binding transcriptional regulator WhiA